MAINKAYFDPDDAVPRLPLPYSIVDDVVAHVLTKAWQAVRARAMTPSVTSFRASVRSYDGAPAPTGSAVSACLARRQAPYTHVHAYEDGHDTGGDFLVRVDASGVVKLSPQGSDEDVVTIHAFTCTEDATPALTAPSFPYDRLDVSDVSFIDSGDTWHDALTCAAGSASLPPQTCAPAPDHALAPSPVSAPAPAAAPEPAPKPRSRDGVRGAATSAPAAKPGSGSGPRPRAVGFAASGTPSHAAPLVAMRVWSSDERDRGFLIAVAATAVSTHAPLPALSASEGDARPATADTASTHKNRRASSGVQPEAEASHAVSASGAIRPTGIVRLFHVPAYALSLGAVVDVTDAGVCVWRTRPVAPSASSSDDSPTPAPIRLLGQMALPCGITVASLSLSMDGRFMAISGSDAATRIVHLDPRIVTPPPLPPVLPTRPPSASDDSVDDGEEKEEEGPHDARERPVSRGAVPVKLKLPTPLRAMITLICPWIQGLFEAPPAEVFEPEPAPTPAPKQRAGSARKGGHAAPAEPALVVVVQPVTPAAPAQRVTVPLETGVYFTCVRLHSPGAAPSDDAAPPPRDSDAASSVHTASRGHGISRASARSSGHTHVSRGTRVRSSAAATAAVTLPLNVCGSDGVPVCVGVVAWWRYVGHDAAIHARAPAVLYRWTFHTHDWTHAVMLPYIESRAGGPEDPRPLPPMLCDDVAQSHMHAPPCAGDAYPSLTSHTTACGEPRIVLGHADGTVAAYAPLRVHSHAPRRSPTQAVTCVAVLGCHSVPHGVTSSLSAPLHAVARLAIDARGTHAASVSAAGQLHLYTLPQRNDASELRVYDGDAKEAAVGPARLYGLISGPGLDSAASTSPHTLAVRWDTYTHVHALGFTPGVDPRGAYHPFLHVHACEGTCDASGSIVVQPHAHVHAREALYVYDVRAAHLMGSVTLRAATAVSPVAAAALAVWDAAAVPNQPLHRSGNGVQTLLPSNAASYISVIMDAAAPRCCIVSQRDAWPIPLTTIAVNAYPILTRAIARLKDETGESSSTAALLGFWQVCDGAARLNSLSLSTSDLLAAVSSLSSALQAQAQSALRAADDDAAVPAPQRAHPRGRRPSETGASVMTHTHAGESVSPPAASPHTSGSPPRGFSQPPLPHEGEGDVWVRSAAMYVGTERFQLPNNARERATYYATIVPQARDARLTRLHARLEARLQPTLA